jgi:endoglucanase
MTANRRIIWGSNKMAAEEGILLFHAYELTGRRSYLEGAAAQAGYLLGMNPFCKSFVTGIGANPVANVSHLFARAIGRDIPGLLVGGPNEQAQAGIAPMNRGLRSYVDDARSYATNEYAIDYNASLITLLGLLSWQARSGPVQTN